MQITAYPLILNQAAHYAKQDPHFMHKVLNRKEDTTSKLNLPSPYNN